jgi:hypothetical protein
MRPEINVGLAKQCVTFFIQGKKNLPRRFVRGSSLMFAQQSRANLSPKFRSKQLALTPA